MISFKKDDQSTRLGTTLKKVVKFINKKLD